MYRQQRGCRVEYRLLERQRVETSASLAGTFPRLKTLKVELTYCQPDDHQQRRQVKYEVNLTNAKSVFLFTCPDGDCSQGDFDLSEMLAAAIARRQRVVTGEVFCRGWQNLITARRVQCHNSLQYKFNLTYSSGNS